MAEYESAPVDVVTATAISVVSFVIFFTFRLQSSVFNWLRSELVCHSVLIGSIYFGVWLAWYVIENIPQMVGPPFKVEN